MAVIASLGDVAGAYALPAAFVLVCIVFPVSCCGSEMEGVQCRQAQATSAIVLANTSLHPSLCCNMALWHRFVLL